jgi:hypothetical protein
MQNLRRVSQYLYKRPVSKFTETFATIRFISAYAQQLASHNAFRRCLLSLHHVAWYSEMVTPFPKEVITRNTAFHNRTFGTSCVLYFLIIFFYFFLYWQSELHLWANSLAPDKMIASIQLQFQEAKNYLLSMLIKPTSGNEVLSRHIWFINMSFAARSKAWNLFARSNTGIVSSSFTQGIHVCVYVVLCRQGPWDGLIPCPRSLTDCL